MFSASIDVIVSVSSPLTSLTNINLDSGLISKLSTILPIPRPPFDKFDIALFFKVSYAPSEMINLIFFS